MNTIIFDFDGTIADSFAVIVEIFHELTHRTKLVTPEEIVKLRHMRLIDVAKAEKIPKWRIPLLMILGRRRMSARLKSIQPFGGISEVIKYLHNENFVIIIISSNSTYNVRKFLSEHKLSQYFTNIYGGVGLLGKARVLKHIIKKYKVIPQNCIYIGDEPRDILASKEVGIKSIAVTWGFNAKALLKSHAPDALVSSPEDLPNQIRQLLK